MTSESNSEVVAVVSDALAQEHQALAESMMLNRELLERALARVRKFVQEKNLIVYGGLAVHYTHLVNDLAIYGESTLPDYDVLSPDSVNDAYEMAQLLHAADFPDVSVVRAIHVQTMRVRIGPVAVLDMTYVPPHIFEKVPIEVYQGLKFASYKFQLIEMHSVFAYPFRNAPQEDAGFRWSKVQSRINSLLGIVDADGSGFPRSPPDANAFHAIAIPTIPFSYAAAGFFAVALLFDLYKLMREKLELEFTPRHAELLGTTTDFKCPAFCDRVDIVVDHQTIPKGVVKKIFRPLMSFRNRTADADIDGALARLWFLDGDLLAVVKVGSGSDALLLPNAHYVMMYLLTTAMEHPEHADVCLSVYADLLDMARAVNQKLKAIDAPPEVVLGNPFCVNTRVFGKDNYNEANLVSMQGFLARVEGIQPKPPHILPKNHFFGKKEVKIEPYDYEKGRAYFYDGGEYVESEDSSEAVLHDA